MLDSEEENKLKEEVDNTIKSLEINNSNTNTGWNKSISLDTTFLKNPFGEDEIVEGNLSWMKVSPIDMLDDEIYNYKKFN